MVPAVQLLSFDFASRRSGQGLRSKLFEGVEPIEVPVTVEIRDPHRYLRFRVEEMRFRSF